MWHLFIVLIKSMRLTSKKINTRGLNYNIQFNDTDESGVDQFLPILEKTFEGIINQITAGMPGHDQVRMVLQ